MYAAHGRSGLTAVRQPEHIGLLAKQTQQSQLSSPSPDDRPRSIGLGSVKAALRVGSDLGLTLAAVDLARRPPLHFVRL